MIRMTLTMFKQFRLPADLGHITVSDSMNCIRLEDVLDDVVNAKAVKRTSLQMPAQSNETRNCLRLKLGGMLTKVDASNTQ